IENNISEDSGNGFDVEAVDSAIGNQFLGDISLNDFYGFFFTARANSLQYMPQNTIIVDSVAINPVYVGSYLRGTKNTQMSGASFLQSSTNSGYAADRPSDATGDGFPTVYVTNSASISNIMYGFIIVNQGDFLLDYTGGFGNSHNYSPSSSSKITNS